MTKGLRIVVFLGVLVLLVVVVYLGRISLGELGSRGVVLLAALVMLSFVILLLEHFFTTPTDVIASTVAILLLLAPLQDTLSAFGLWYVLFILYNAMLLVAALVALLLFDPDKSTSASHNVISTQLKRFATFFGNGKFLWFALFILTLLFYVDSQSSLFLLLFGYSIVLLLIDPKKYVFSFRANESVSEQDIGEIFGVQSTNTFLAKLFQEHPPIRRFDLVEFQYSLDIGKRVRKGVIIDNYLLNEQQWIKILSDDVIQNALGATQSNEVYRGNVVYRIPEKVETDLLKRLVGTISEGSKIEKIRFEYAFKVPVSEGELVEVRIGSADILYQIVEGITGTESLEQRNEAGVITGEAVQLGVWNNERRAFDRFGWVPNMNSPVLLASEIDPPKPESTEYEIGKIPSTNYPVFINREEAITHHLAVLGVTGSGKSVFIRNLIRNLVGNTTKVICVDFTNEYRHRLADLGLDPIVTGDISEELFGVIDTLSAELEKFPNQRNKATLISCEDSLRKGFSEAIGNFLKSDNNTALFELPDVTNTTGILEYTKWFFKVLFEIAKQDNNFGNRLCVVLEEAHTIIPEWNFIGIDDKRASSLVNSIGQIALQGRKFNVGFVVVAQRTANVSKTVLTQCNSVIAFQQFDRTSSEFLGNYMGVDFVAALTRLKPRHAIAVGKAFRGGVPVIFEVPYIEEPNKADENG